MLPRKKIGAHSADLENIVACDAGAVYRTELLICCIYFEIQERMGKVRAKKEAPDL